MAKSKHYYIRRFHRYFGVILGIQFFLWTLGGLYFSWSNMDEIHGDLQKKSVPLLSSNIALVSPSVVLDSIKRIHRIDSLVSIELIEILGKPFYQIRCVSAINHAAMGHTTMPSMNHLAEAITGKLRGALSEQEAIAVAKARYNGSPVVKTVEYLTNTNGHHEYRESPLPAYAISFEKPMHTTVYVSSELGTVQKFRNDKWRVFDFLWMLHTMDFEKRDNISNWLLRAFSIFGLLTVISGFVLFFISAKWGKKPI
jgi:uncharacterized iron-regulated membrane protein